MYNKIYKNNQVSVGIPFQFQKSLNFNTIKHVEEVYEDNHQENIVEHDTKNYIINRAHEEAEMILREAGLEADRILNEAIEAANEQAAIIEEEAKLKGYEDGYNEMKRQYEDLINEAEHVRDQARIEYKDVLNSIEADAVNIVLDISKKVLDTEMKTNKEVILDIIRQAFEKCSGKENMTLKVSEGDYEFVSNNKDRILGMVEGIGELEIKKDTSLKLGGCVIETLYGTIDAGIQTRMKKIEEAFREVILGK